MKFKVLLIFFALFVLCACIKKQNGDHGTKLAVETLPYLTTIACSGERCQENGVVVYKKGKAQEGYTLVPSFTDMKATLIDMAGKVVHEWTFPPVEYTWSKEKHGCYKGTERAPDSFLCGGHVDMDPQGNLYVIIARQVIMKLDWNGKLLWKVNGQFSHDVDYSQNESVYSLDNRFEQVEVNGQKRNILNDRIIKISHQGLKLQEISLFKILKELVPSKKWEEISSYEKAHSIGKISELYRPDEKIFDLFHANALSFIDRDIPGVCQKGDILLSLAHLNLIVIVNIKSKKLVWQWGTDELQRQHHPTLLSNGHLLLFDNRPKSPTSRVIEVNPVEKKIVWKYEQEGPAAFHSYNRGGSQRLENGNTLITSSNEGRLIEVTRKGEVVWEYLSPMILLKIDKTITYMRDSIYRARRIDVQKIQDLQKIK